MVAARANRLLPLLAGGVVLMSILVLARSCHDEGGDQEAMETVPQAPPPDADTPADTIKTLTANVAAMTAQLHSLRQDNTELRADNAELKTLRQKIEESVTARIKAERAAQPPQPVTTSAGALAALSARVDALADAVTARTAPLAGGDIPVGLGLDGAARSDAVVWIKPLDGTGTHTLPTNGLLRRVEQVTQPAQDADERAVKAHRNAPQPVYTVPRNATLLGASAMTALVGRVPVKGNVRDPMPFKLITGGDNLAANGLTIPGLQGMIWSGTAIGDWTLSCVTGRLESVTFVFDDGTIRTISTDDRDQQNNDANRPLGWISDDRGIPCISGERHSNAAAFLTQTIGIKALEAAAEAAAAAQTTSVVQETGAVTGSVTGKTGRFVLGKTLAGGSEAIAQWLVDRQAQNFDAVFVPAGAALAIHVDRELSIDRDPHGRRLSYETTDKTPSPTELD